jgi:pimeloyl-ACP methyl ester carboxylesterase
VLVGFSLGGNMSLYYGASRPHRCLALVPMEASDHSPTHSPQRLALLTHPRVNPAQYMGPQATTLAGDAADQPTREFNEWYGLTIIGVTTQADLEIYSEADSRELMPRITCPVLMLRGEQDWIVPQFRVDEAASRITNSRRLESRTLAGVGHFPPLEAPKLVASEIAQFLNAALPA